MPYRESRDKDDEKHQHPLQLDVIQRAVQMWTNENDAVLTPFMGVGSEVFGAVQLGRRGIGCELKPSYFRQAVKNLEECRVLEGGPKHRILFGDEEIESPDELESVDSAQ